MISPNSHHPHHYILILEDSASLVAQISLTLRASFPNLQVLPARTIAEAQVLLAEQPIDLFLIDIHLPDGTGLDFVCDVMTEHPGAKVMIITAVPLPEYREHARNLGILQFVEKPLDFDWLSRKVGGALGLSAVNAASAAGSVSSAPTHHNFSASLSALTPIDIIQLKCLSRGTNAIEFIRFDGRRGRIFFKDGEVIHAETDGSAGVDAFNEIVGWRSGRVLEPPDVRPARMTINEHWQHLLMDAVHRLDGQAAATAN